MSEPERTAPATYTVEEAAKLLGIGRNQGYDAVRANTIPNIRIGKRILIPRVALLRLLSGDAPQRGTAA